MSAPAFPYSSSTSLPLSATDASPDDEGDGSLSLRRMLEENELCTCGGMLRVDCTDCGAED